MEHLALVNKCGSFTAINSSFDGIKYVLRSDRIFHAWARSMSWVIRSLIQIQKAATSIVSVQLFDIWFPDF